MNQFETLRQEVERSRKLSASHKTRLERIVTLYHHVTALERDRDAADNYYPGYKREAIQRRLDQFKKPSYFMDALEALAAEVRAL